MSFSWPDEEEVGFSLNGCIVSGEEDGAANEMKLTFLLLHPVSVDNPDGDGAASLDNKIVRLGGREVLFSKTYHQPRSSRQGGALHLALMIPEQATVGGGSGSVVDTLYKYVEVKNGQKKHLSTTHPRPSPSRRVWALLFSPGKIQIHRWVAQHQDERPAEVRGDEEEEDEKSSVSRFNLPSHAGRVPGGGPPRSRIGQATLGPGQSQAGWDR